MKTFISQLILSLFFFTITSHAQVGVEWSAEIEMPDTGVRSPKMDLLADGTPVVIWGNSDNIYLSRLENEIFTDAINVPVANTPDIYSFGGLDLAVHNNTVFIIYENFTNGIYIVRSTDGGLTFDTPVNVYDPEPGKWATLASVAVDDIGNPFVSVILENTNETDGKYIVMRSADAGLTFSEPVIANDLSNGDFVCECCTSDIYIKGDEFFLAFRNNDNNLRDMWVTKSSDGGASFTEAVDIDATDWMLNGCPISGPNVAPMASDSLISAWMSGANGAAKVYVSTFNGSDLGHEFEMGLPDINGGSSQSGPSIAGANDTIGLVWEQSGFGVNGIDIMFSFSTTGAADLFNNMVNVTDWIGNQKFPDLIYSNGEFHVLYNGGFNHLIYRKGTFAILDNLSSIPIATNSISLLHQPIKNQLIQLSSDEFFARSFQIQLLDISGRTIQSWNNQQFNSEGKLDIETSMLNPGMYFLQVGNQDFLWSEKVLQVD